jgi:preprotein translocase subunit YajC
VTTYAIIAEDTQQDATGSGGAKAPQSPCDQNMIFLLVAMGIVFYFILWRPQRKKEKEERTKREEMMKNLKKSDHVVTRGGICGVVAAVTEDEVTVKVDEKNDVRIRFLREAILNVITEEDEKTDEKKDGKKSDDSSTDKR